MTLSSCHHMCFLQVDRGHIQRVELAPPIYRAIFSTSRVCGIELSGTFDGFYRLDRAPGTYLAHRLKQLMEMPEGPFLSSRNADIPKVDQATERSA